MELLVLILIGFLILVVVLPFVAMSRASEAKRTVDDLFARLLSLENEVHTLRQSGSATKPEPHRSVTGMSEEGPGPETAPRAATLPPPLPVIPEAPKKSEPPAILSKPVETKLPPAIQAKSPIDWEQFMGAKLFAWIGGLALFLGVAFFVKYSFEHNLIPPELRVAIGFVVGVALLVGGVLLKRKENAVIAQTLCATGVLVLYTVTFACRGYYHFAFFGLIPTFLSTPLITPIACL